MRLLASCFNLQDAALKPAHPFTFSRYLLPASPPSPHDFARSLGNTDLEIEGAGLEPTHPLGPPAKRQALESPSQPLGDSLHTQTQLSLLHQPFQTSAPPPAGAGSRHGMTPTQLPSSLLSVRMRFNVGCVVPGWCEWQDGGQELTVSGGGSEGVKIIGRDACETVEKGGGARRVGQQHRGTQQQQGQGGGNMEMDEQQVEQQQERQRQRGQAGTGAAATAAAAAAATAAATAATAAAAAVSKTQAYACACAGPLACNTPALLAGAVWQPPRRFVRISLCSSKDVNSQNCP